MANEKLVRNFKQKKKHAQRDEYIMKGVQLAASLKKTSGVLLKLK